MELDYSKIPIVFETHHPRQASSSRTASLSVYKITATEPKFLHYHHYIEIGICNSGSGLVYMNGGTHEYNESDIQIVLPYQPHYNVCAKDSESSTWTFICFSPLKIESEGIKPQLSFTSDLIQNKISANGIFSASEFPRLARLCNELAESCNCDDNYKNERIILKELEILIELSNISSSGSFSPQKSMDDSFDLILPAINLVRKNITNSLHISVLEMAAACNMSESHFRKTFTSITGYSPKAYLNKTLMNTAADALSDINEPIGSILLRLGFEEASTFYRMFTKHFGVSPSEYRKQAQRNKK